MRDKQMVDGEQRGEEADGEDKQIHTMFDDVYPERLYGLHGATRGKRGPMGIRGMLPNKCEEVLLMFSKNVGVQIPMKWRFWQSWKLFVYFLLSFRTCWWWRVTSNVGGWVSRCGSRPWKFQFHFNDIKKLSSGLDFVFCHEVGLANSMEDALAKLGVDRTSPWLGFSL